MLLKKVKISCVPIVVSMLASLVASCVVATNTTTTLNAWTRNINHVGVSVPNLNATVAWYTSVLGFKLLQGPVTFSRATNPDSFIFLTYPPPLQTVQIAWLTMGMGVGFEVFQFIDPPYLGPTNNNGTLDTLYRRGGVFHLGITDPDPLALAERVVKAGGKQVGEFMPYAQGGGAVYVMDPWGNVIEALSKSTEALFSNLS